MQPGQRVAEGQPLVQFFMEQEHAERERLQKEFDLQLLKLLRDPSDSSARQSLSALRAQRELAATRLAAAAGARAARRRRQRRAHPARAAPRPSASSSSPSSATTRTLSMVALLPGRYRPMLHAGHAAALRAGRLSLRVSRAAPSTPSATRSSDRPKRSATSAPVSPTASPSTSRSCWFAPSCRRDASSPSGESYHYFDGLHARAEARVRSEPIVLTVLPALKELFDHGS